jgi:hypothetical protein
MTENENAPAETRWADEPLTADERARAELAKEARQNEAPVENLQGIGADALIDDERAERAELFGALSQSVSGRHLTDRDIDRAQTAALEFEKIAPQAAEAWSDYARGSADRLGFVMDALANGTLPSGPPSAHAADLAAVDTKHTAKRALESLLKEAPPGSEKYREPDMQRRIQALYGLIHGDTPLVGHSLRRV